MCSRGGRFCFRVKGKETFSLLLGEKVISTTSCLLFSLLFGVAFFFFSCVEDGGSYRSPGEGGSGGLFRQGVSHELAKHCSLAE